MNESWTSSPRGRVAYSNTLSSRLFIGLVNDIMQCLIMSVPGKNRHGTVADSSETVKYHEYLKLLKSHCVHVALLQFTLVV